MRGLLVYSKKDFHKNVGFANWLKEVLQVHRMEVDFLLLEDLSQTFSFSSFEFVINRSRDYHFSLICEMYGLRVFNRSEVTLLGNNKLAAYAYAAKKGFLYAPLVFPPDKTKEVIVKPICGHGGEGIHLYQGERIQNDCLYQSFIKDYEGDVRFYVINNEIQQAVIRIKSEDSLCSNFSKGNSFRTYDFSKKEERTVHELMGDLSFDYVGIDFLLLKDGRLLFNEIEDVVGSRMLSSLGKNDMVKKFANHIKQEMKR